MDESQDKIVINGLKPFDKQVDDVLSGADTTSSHLEVLKVTPPLLRMAGVPNLPILMTARHVRTITQDSGTDSANYHGLGVELIKKLPELISDPVMIMDSISPDAKAKNSVVIVTQMVDKENRPVIGAIRLNGIGRQDSKIISANILTSAYGKDNFQSFIERNIEQGSVLYADKEKSQALSVNPGIQFPDVMASLSFDTIIRKTNAFVNSEEENNSEITEKNEGSMTADNNNANAQAARERVQQVRDGMVKTLLEHIEKNPTGWQAGWNNIAAGAPYNGKTNTAYRGMNALYLAFLGAARGYKDTRWVTFNQAKELGASVKKGEKSSPVVFFEFYDRATKKAFDKRTVKDMTDEEKAAYVKENVYAVLKYSSVFNAEQCHNFPERKDVAMSEEERAKQNVKIEAIIANSGAPVRYDGGSRAYYSPGTDSIHLPEIKAFDTMQDYYATALHEIAHSTGHESRLKRDLSGGFGSESYAKEELRAELACVFMQMEQGIQLNGKHITNHAAYLNSWLEAAKNDTSVFFKAAADAQRIADYVADNYMQATAVAGTADENAAQEQPERNPMAEYLRAEQLNRSAVADAEELTWEQEENTDVQQFLNKTRYGSPVNGIAEFPVGSGKFVAIIDNSEQKEDAFPDQYPPSFIIAHDYNPQNGEWKTGAFGFSHYEEARSYYLEQYGIDIGQRPGAELYDSKHTEQVREHEEKTERIPHYEISFTLDYSNEMLLTNAFKELGYSRDNSLDEINERNDIAAVNNGESRWVNGIRYLGADRKSFQGFYGRVFDGIMLEATNITGFITSGLSKNEVNEITDVIRDFDVDVAVKEIPAPNAVEEKMTVEQARNAMLDAQVKDTYHYAVRIENESYTDPFDGYEGERPMQNVYVIDNDGQIRYHSTYMLNDYISEGKLPYGWNETRKYERVEYKDLEKIASKMREPIEAYKDVLRAEIEQTDERKRSDAYYEQRAMDVLEEHYKAGEGAFERNIENPKYLSGMLYAEETRFGKKVVSLTQDESGKNIAIIAQANGQYAVAEDYSPEDGRRWGKAHYFDDQKSAEEFRAKNYPSAELKGVGKEDGTNKTDAENKPTVNSQMERRISAYAESLKKIDVELGYAARPEEYYRDRAMKEIAAYERSDEYQQALREDFPKDFIDDSPQDMTEITQNPQNIYCTDFGGEYRYFRANDGVSVEDICKGYALNPVEGFAYSFGREITEKQYNDILSIEKGFNIDFLDDLNAFKITQDGKLIDSGYLYEDLVLRYQERNEHDTPPNMPQTTQNKPVEAQERKREWLSIELPDGAVGGKYGENAMIKMPKGEFSYYAFYVPAKMLKEADGKTQLRVASDYTFRLNNDGKQIELSGQELKDSFAGKHLDKTYKRVAPSRKYAQGLENLEKNVPAELKEIPTWCCYRTRWNDEKGKKDKFIISPIDGKWTSSKEPGRWVTFDAAMKYARENNCEGLSVLLDKKYGITCIDLDKCIEAGTGTLNERASKLVETLSGTYIERSTSGNGLHIFVKDDILKDGRYNMMSVDKDKGDLEVYDDKRIMSLTGDMYSKGNALTRAGSAATVYLRQELGERRGTSSGAGSAPRPTGSLTMGDGELVRWIQGSKQGSKFNDLYHGRGVSGNRSDDDAKLAHMLLYFNGGDKDQTFRIMRESGAYRPDKPDSYYRATIDKMDAKIEVYAKRPNFSADGAGKSKGKVPGNGKKGSQA